MLAATQAMSIYTIMRVIDHGRDYFIMNREMINTMAVRQLTRSRISGHHSLILDCTTEARNSFRASVPRACEPTSPTGTSTDVGGMDPRRDSEKVRWDPLGLALAKSAGYAPSR